MYTFVRGINLSLSVLLLATTYVQGGIRSKPLVVTESGSAKGYHLITPATKGI